MKIGILITSISNFGQKGYYNSQEVGLAKALSKVFDAVEVYKLVPIENEKKSETIENSKNARIHFIPAKNFGINGLLDTGVLETTLNALIHFSDTQFSVPTAYMWCKNNKIQYIPYIGVIESHSTSKVKQFITNLMFRRNVSIYKKCTCCVKTPFVQSQLKKLGVYHTLVTPVGVDLDLLRIDYESFSIVKLKVKYGYSIADKVLLFVGRLIDEKQPVRMVEIYADVARRDSNYKLLMVGTGELQSAVQSKIKELRVENSVQMLERIPNSDIWELYRFAEAFVNLNQQEIFGMAILEAMYYGCKVVAWEAPGPNFIITDCQTGYLTKSNQQIIDLIFDSKDVSEASHRRIVEEFTWDSMAKKVVALTGGQNG